jgi:hypothetical protein
MSSKKEFSDVMLLVFARERYQKPDHANLREAEFQKHTVRHELVAKSFGRTRSHVLRMCDTSRVMSGFFKDNENETNGHRETKEMNMTFQLRIENTFKFSKTCSTKNERQDSLYTMLRWFLSSDTFQKPNQFVRGDKTACVDLFFSCEFIMGKIILVKNSNRYKLALCG